MPNVPTPLVLRFFRGRR